MPAPSWGPRAILYIELSNGFSLCMKSRFLTVSYKALYDLISGHFSIIFFFKSLHIHRTSAYSFHFHPLGSLLPQIFLWLLPSFHSGLNSNFTSSNTTLSKSSPSQRIPIPSIISAPAALFSLLFLVFISI